jgi:hypothetical protein
MSDMAKQMAKVDSTVSNMDKKNKDIMEAVDKVKMLFAMVILLDLIVVLGSQKCECRSSRILFPTKVHLLWMWPGRS